jgi:hypothetical protein
MMAAHQCWRGFAACVARLKTHRGGEKLTAGLTLFGDIQTG